MTRTLKYSGVAALFAAFVLCSCSAPLAQHEKWESYDQENLKRYDIGCPTAVFIAPNGELRQCQFRFYRFQADPSSAPPEFDTAEAAAIAGFKVIAAKPNALFYEWGGQIAQFADGKFSALPANTSYSGDSVYIHSSTFGLNAKIVGAYHTHPCLPEHDVEFFSAPDLEQALYFKRLVFMGDFCTGTVHEFKPGDNPATEATGSPGLFLTKGRIIGQFTTTHGLTVAE